jgi:hypothetical protein
MRPGHTAEDSGQRAMEHTAKMTFRTRDYGVRLTAKRHEGAAS